MTTSTNQVPEVRCTRIPKSADSTAELEKGIVTPTVGKVKQIVGVQKSPNGVEMHIVNPPKSDPLAYPISTYTYVIVPKQTAHAPELRKMIFWALTQGQQAKYTAPLLFVPLPKTVLVASEKTLKTIHT